jgi:hypothetical protein
MIRTQDLLMALNIQFKATIYSSSSSSSSSSSTTAAAANKKKVVLKPPKQSKKKQQRLTSYTRLFLETGHPLIFQYPFYTSQHDMTHSRIEQWIAQVKVPAIRPSLLFGYQTYPTLQWMESHSLQFWSTLSPHFYNYIHEVLRIMCILLARDSTRWNWCLQLSRFTLYQLLYSTLNWVIPHDPQPLLDDSWIQSPQQAFSGFHQLHSLDSTVTTAADLPSIDSFFQSHYHPSSSSTSSSSSAHKASSSTNSHKKKRTLLSAKRQRRSSTTKKADVVNDSIDTS